MPRMPRTTDRSQRTSFVGRDRELDAIHGWLRARDRVLLTIVGAPGAGKTRLVHEAVAQAVVEPERVLWVDLHGATSEDVPARLALARGLATGEWGAIVRALRECVDVVVLDECEAAIGGVAEAIARLGAAIPTLRLIATSRSVLGLAGERPLVLDAFGKPSPDAPLASSPSGRLLLDRITVLEPSWSLSPLDEPHLRAIVERFGDLPLALELVAPQIVDLGAAAVAARLHRPLDLLAGERRDDPRDSLDEALARSFAGLSEEQRTAIAQLAQLGRPFDIDDAEAVLGARAIAFVRALRDRSWLVRSGNPPSFDVLPPIRQFIHARPEAVLTADAEERIDDALLEGAARGRLPALERLLDAARRRPRAPLLAEALRRAYSALAIRGRLADLAKLARELDHGDGALLRISVRAATEAARFDEAQATLDEIEKLARSRPDLVTEVAVARARIDFRTGRYDRVRDLDVPPGCVPPEDVEVIASAASIRGEHELAVAIHRRAIERAGEEQRPAIRAMLARLLAETGEGEAALAEVALSAEGRALDARVALSLDATQALVAHDRRELPAAIARYDSVIARYAAVGNMLAAYFRFLRAIAALEDERREEAIASSLAALEDVPPGLVQLAPLVELASFVGRGVEPAGPMPEVPVVAASTRLVRAYVRRCTGDATDVEAAWSANADHARWSVTSRVLARVAREAPAITPTVASLDLILAHDASWFAVAGGPQVSLATRNVLQRVLVHLADRAHETPGAFSSIDTIAAAAWPGERILERARRSRVHVAVSTLRALGLRERLAHGPGGYRLEGPLRRVR